MTLREIQQRMAAALMTPLTAGERIARKTREGASMALETATLIKPNDRLTSLERLEIYSRSYWFRLLDVLRDDFPGLIAILGPAAFDRLATAYLAGCPSRSFTLRDLGSRLEAWLEENPQYAGQNRVLAQDMARLEWAHVVAFDGPAEKILGPEDLLELNPTLRVGLQPYISLVELHYPVDVLRVKLRAAPEDSSSTSNVAVKKKQRVLRKPGRLGPEAIFLAVHRLDSSVYYKRLSSEEFRLLAALRAGRSIASAISTAFRGGSVPPEEIPGRLKIWFASWAEFGWLSVRAKTKEGTQFS